MLNTCYKQGMKMLLFFLLCLFPGAVSPSKEQEVELLRGGCPMFWFSFNGRCYKYVATPMTWADAEFHCLEQGANLVSIHSLEENNFVKMLIGNFDHAERWTWIGLTDIQKEGLWFWSDGSKVSFTDWENGQPDNGPGGENCGQINFGPNKKWNDYICSYTYSSVCKSRPVYP
ncbi:galactose-specific lectin nattectin-like [Cololabis saira]|uniref:galactose-specific lectin nattectin-like n=1 Tax=Cololabis saira TaxID=129043 RepID=UPI002AD20270|nr:galactose-specific lectin nattectin-like [Cololabis saira]